MLLPLCLCDFKHDDLLNQNTRQDRPEASVYSERSLTVMASTEEAVLHRNWALSWEKKNAIK